LEIGDAVRVCDGAFTAFRGIIEDVDEGLSRLKVTVLMFGSAAPVELERRQVEKL
jgi:transcription termination/antitermination protein NusG